MRSPNSRQHENLLASTDDSASASARLVSSAPGSRWQQQCQHGVDVVNVDRYSQGSQAACTGKALRQHGSGGRDVLQRTAAQEHCHCSHQHVLQFAVDSQQVVRCTQDSNMFLHCEKACSRDLFRLDVEVEHPGCPCRHDLGRQISTD